MAENKKTSSRTRRQPAATPEARENQLIAMAMDEAEKQFREGTASTQIIAHFLKLGSTRDSLEKQMLREKTKLVTAQVDSIESQKQSALIHQEALDAMRRYGGNQVHDYD